MKRSLTQSLILIISLLMVGLTQPQPAQAQLNTGYQDFDYGSARAPTGDKPQSKVWFNDGIWWGVLYNHVSNYFEIYKLDWTTQDWSSTGIPVDDRLHSTHDALSVNGKLFIVSAAIPPTTGPPIIPPPDNPNIYVITFNYNSVNDTYLSTGTATVYSNWVESVVIDYDSLDRLWITFTEFNPGNQTKSVFVAHTQGNTSNWLSPGVLEFPEAQNLKPDDISTLVASNGEIGVMWSNQTPDNQNKTNVYFAIHEDSDADHVWSLDTVLNGAKYADDHLNIKSLQADSAGKVFAVVKTSTNDAVPVNPGAPLVYLLIKSTNGNWSQREVVKVVDNWTRPILLIDEENREIYIFGTLQIGIQTTGSIYYKHINLDDPGLQFDAGPGIAFIENPDGATDFTHINNASSTKQPLNSTTNLLVIAGDDSKQMYVHNIIDLLPPPEPPVFNIFLPMVVK